MCIDGTIIGALLMMVMLCEDVHHFPNSHYSYPWFHPTFSIFFHNTVCLLPFYICCLGLSSFISMFSFVEVYVVGVFVSLYNSMWIPNCHRPTALFINHQSTLTSFHCT